MYAFLLVPGSVVQLFLICPTLPWLTVIKKESREAVEEAAINNVMEV